MVRRHVGMYMTTTRAIITLQPHTPLDVLYLQVYTGILLRHSLHHIQCLPYSSVGPDFEIRVHPFSANVNAHLTPISAFAIRFHSFL